MAADESDKKSRQSRDFPTVKVEAVVGPADATQESAPEEGTTASYIPAADEFAALRAAMKKGGFRDEEADTTTEMISRDEIYRNALADRSQNRGSRPTVQFIPQELKEMNREQTQVTAPERPAVRPEFLRAQAQPPVVDLEGTMEFARHGIASVNEAEGEMEFPARVDAAGRIPIPKELARDLGIEAGSLVVVTVRKITS